MLQLAEHERACGNQVRTFSRKWYAQKPATQGHTCFGYTWENIAHRILGPITGRECCFSGLGTRKLIRELKRFRPDIVHLHNLHGWYIHLPHLFQYLKASNVAVVWTLHDCWAFTGHCPHFLLSGCQQWRTACQSCPSYREFPESLTDNAKKMHLRKKEWFLGLKRLQIVTPSRWLADLAKKSFLAQYPVRSIGNGIDLRVFQPTESAFRKKYDCENQFLVLGVSFEWDANKGLEVFRALADRLDDTYRIVLVGTDHSVDKLLPDQIISIHRTANQKELAEIYTAADLFVNPTWEDNYPTVNMEALACGTPVLTFRTGGSPEIPDETCGSVVERGDVDALEQELRRIRLQQPYSVEQCVQRAAAFDKARCALQYGELYRSMLYDGAAEKRV